MNVLGQFLNGKRHGSGTYTYPNNDVYEGAWENDFKHGQGTYTYHSSGSKVNPPKAYFLESRKLESRSLGRPW
jgi:hypothetical protein